jgi:hypothetical protein
MNQSRFAKHSQVMGKQVWWQTEILIQFAIAGVAGHQLGEDAYAVRLTQSFKYVYYFG